LFRHNSAAENNPTSAYTIIIFINYRPTETNLCTFGRNRNPAETQISITAATVTGPKLVC